MVERRPTPLFLFLTLFKSMRAFIGGQQEGGGERTRWNTGDHKGSSEDDIIWQRRSLYRHRVDTERDRKRERERKKRDDVYDWRFTSHIYTQIDASERTFLWYDPPYSRGNNQSFQLVDPLAIHSNFFEQDRSAAIGSASRYGISLFWVS